LAKRFSTFVVPAFGRGLLKPILLIPAYRPGSELPELIRKLSGSTFHKIIVVNDGSGGEYESVFARCTATVLSHGSNRGKGAALKTGISYVLSKDPECSIVTADADGQHAPEDILRVAERLVQTKDSLILGARRFQEDTPARSKFGNQMSQLLVKAIIGSTITDTQTGLRGIPAKMLQVLAKLRPNGYEFELDMLTAAKHLAVPIVEVPIQAIYQPGNPTSHFRPFRDSLRVGFVLMRFSLLSLATALLDNAVFFVLNHNGASVLAAQVAARTASVLFNYPLARRSVFLSSDSHKKAFPLYVLLVIVSGSVSYALLTFFHAVFGWPVLASKLVAESILFLVNFIVQRDFIFIRRAQRTGSN
jgi:putative flippase GtrA